MLTSIGDAHVEVTPAANGAVDIDASASLQRVGVGADVGTDTRPSALKTLGTGSARISKHPRVGAAVERPRRRRGSRDDAAQASATGSGSSSRPRRTSRSARTPGPSRTSAR